ncbi:MAG TPA: hypothetical protein VK957_10265 [Lunatimonas sp.]|nr:hypothetical protein [Lunatimonas sp.]
MLAFAMIGYLLLTILLGICASRKVKNPKDLMLAGRQLPLFLSVSALFATWFGSELIGESSMLLLVSLFVPLTAGLYWKRSSSPGAILAISFGLLSILILYSMDFTVPAHLSSTEFSALGMVFGSIFSPKTPLHASLS